MHREAQELIDFWFGVPPATEPRAVWFKKDPTFDAEIRSRFGAALEQALAGGLREWDDHPEGVLARIVLLDQFPRNAFRGTARAFAGDAMALPAARALVASGADLSLGGFMRQFAYMPFEHAEDAAAQAEALRLFARLGADHPALADLEGWAKKHADIVTRFGRFPHRNAVLGRESTAEEIEFLRQPGSSF
jgi:uncharacterized protein (DUF924 family)